MRNAGFVGRIFGTGLGVLCKSLDKTRALAWLPEGLPEAGTRVRSAILRHPDREARKDYRAYEPKWMKDGLTTLS